MSESLNWDELDHADDWPDRTTREPDLEPDDFGKNYLEILEIKLATKADDPAVRAWASANLGENYPEGLDDND